MVLPLAVPPGICVLSVTIAGISMFTRSTCCSRSQWRTDGMRDKPETFVKCRSRRVRQASVGWNIHHIGDLLAYTRNYLKIDPDLTRIADRVGVNIEIELA